MVLDEDFVGLDEAELGAGLLFDHLQPLAQVAQLGQDLALRARALSFSAWAWVSSCRSWVMRGRLPLPNQS